MVPLPALAGRESMVRKLLTADNCDMERVDFKQVAVDTEHYSGSDLKLLCKEAAMQPVRRLMSKMDALDDANEGEDQHQHAAVHPEDISVQLEKMTPEDVTHALSKTRPTARLFTDKYLAWQKEYGSN